MCNPGWGECGGGACTTDLTADSDNCGDCGNACGSGTCAMGSCQRVDMLAKDLTSPGQVVVNSSHVYFADQHTTPILGQYSYLSCVVASVPLSGGSVQRVAVFAGGCPALAADTNELYGLTQDAPGQVMLVYPLSGTAVPDAGFGTSLAVGDNSLWWLDVHLNIEDAGVVADAGVADAEAEAAADAAEDGAGAWPFYTDLVRAAAPDFGPQIVATVPGVNLSGGLAIGGGDAFFSSNADVVVVRAGTSMVQTLATDSQPV
ncbi:MAG: hypothetical protein ACREOE_21085, partial [Gemmatimonadales bacterium]